MGNATTGVRLAVAGLLAVATLGGVAVAAGMVPEAGEAAPAASITVGVEAPLTSGSDTGSDAVDPVDTTLSPEPAAAPPATTPPPTTPPPTTPPPTAPPTTSPPPTSPPTTSAPPTTSPPPPTTPPTTVPAMAPRVQPSPIQVQGAINGITSLVSLPFFFQVTPAYVEQFGNEVCTAFDEGQTAEQVKANGLAQASQFVNVTPEAADYAVTTAVELYCPAYLPLLG